MSQHAEELRNFFELITTGRDVRGPSSPEDLAAVSILSEPVVEHFRGDEREITAFPALAFQLSGKVDRSDWDVGPLVRVIGQDAAIAAHVIKAANSAYYAGVKEIETLPDAVVRMGTKQAADVAVAAAVKALFDPGIRAAQRTLPDVWNRLWVHSLRTAAGARWLALSVGKGDPERAFLGGLLHDIGKTFALRSLTSLIVSGVLKASVSEEVAFEILERVHCEVGVEVAVFWNFPEYLTSICLLHHGASPPPDDAAELHLIRVASGMDEILGHSWYDPSLIQEMQISAEILGVDAATLYKLAERLPTLGEQLTSGF